MAVNISTIKTQCLALYAEAKTTELTDDDFAEGMAIIIANAVLSAEPQTQGLADTNGDTLLTNTTVL